MSLTLSAEQCSFESLYITFSLQRISDEDDTLYCLKSFFSLNVFFVARGGDPECEERSAYFVFPLMESVQQSPTEGTPSMNKVMFASSEDFSGLFLFTVNIFGIR